MNMRIIVIAISFLLTVSAALTLVQCDHSNMARLTIHIQNDLYAQKSDSVIDKLLGFISTKVYAMDWNPNHSSSDGTLTLYVTGNGIEIEANIPPGNATYTLELPAGNEVNIKLLFETTEGQVQTTWGGQKTISLDMGNNDVSITMLPMTEFDENFIPPAAPPPVYFQWYSISLTLDPEPTIEYNIYRAALPGGPQLNAPTDDKYIKIHSTSGSGPFTDNDWENHIVYFYKISVTIDGQEGLLSPDYYEAGPFNEPD